MFNNFGFASAGLKSSVHKSSVLPIQCTESEVKALQGLLCQFMDFPCKYLGLPLSLCKLTRAQIQPIIFLRNQEEPEAPTANALKRAKSTVTKPTKSKEGETETTSVHHQELREQRRKRKKSRKLRVGIDP